MATIELDSIEATHDPRDPAVFVEKGVLRPDVTAEETAVMFWVLIDPALYHRMVVQSGWARERFRDWLREQFVSQLMVPRS